MNIFIDLETIGCTNEAVIAELTAGIKPPANYKSREAIAKWQDENGAAAAEEAVKKTSFDGALGQIVCVGHAIDDGDADATCGTDERALLTAFFADVQEAGKLATKSGSRIDMDITFIGHNVASFDLRFLFHRAVVLGIKPPASIMKAIKAKAWDACIFDTMVAWNPERDKRISLDKLCKALGIQTPKGELDGSKVWDYYRAGRYQDIADYCRKDVNATREVYRRLVFA